MNLLKLFAIQKELDDRIVKEKDLNFESLKDNMILALRVEIAECANEWRGFKHWSNDQKPRPKLLEEYVDGLHFVLSLGNRYGVHSLSPVVLPSLPADITCSFNILISYRWEAPVQYKYGLGMFLQIGKQLGFTEDQIEQAYLEKNKVNHTRQDTGY